MSLPIFTTTNQDLSKMQTRWASQLNPLLSNVLSGASILKNIKLNVGDNTINHLHGQELNGYIPILYNGYSQIYAKESSLPKLTIILNSSAAVTCDILVF